MSLSLFFRLVKLVFISTRTINLPQDVQFSTVNCKQLHALISLFSQRISFLRSLEWMYRYGSATLVLPKKVFWRRICRQRGLVVGLQTSITESGVSVISFSISSRVINNIVYSYTTWYLSNWCSSCLFL